ncbi:MAG: translesion DNA synthesis-associated protein ImuA [Nevskiales bacterium]
MTTYPVKPGFRAAGASLDQLLRQGQLWRGVAAGIAVEPTGRPMLDRLLPGGGWPLGTLTELLHEQTGIGEFSLLLPALARLTQSGRRVALVQIPHLPHPVPLAQAGVDLSQLIWVEVPDVRGACWAAEQLLKSGSVGALASWAVPRDETDLRRLQLAAEEGAALAFLYRPLRAATQFSPAALRLVLRREQGELQIKPLKLRGAPSGRALQPEVLAGVA